MATTKIDSRFFAFWPLAVLMIAATARAQPAPSSDPATSADSAPGLSLMEARSGFVTRIIKDLRDPDRAPPAGNVPPPNSLVHYRSPVGLLAAYLTVDPKDGKKHPAVIWAHGGFGGIDSDFFEKLPEDNEQTPRAFQQAGFVVMLPSWRGTNDNPGKPEFFFGEVDDLVAAVEYAGALPYVDPNRVYVVGHSTGGTLALLAAEASNHIAAAFAFGPTADVARVAGPGQWDIPFDRTAPREIQLRSAIHFIAALKTPTFCIEGFRSPNGRNFPELQAAAGSAPLHTFVIPHGTHFNILYPLTRVIAAKIMRDDGASCNIAISQRELDDAFNKFLDARAKLRTKPLVNISPAAAVLISNRATALGGNQDDICLIVDLTPDDKIKVALVHHSDPADIISNVNGVKLALTPEANRALIPITLDEDPATHQLRIVHVKK